MSTDPTAIDIVTDPRERRFVGVTAHGGFHFDVPFITEITDNLWQGGCANGLVLPDFIVHLISVYPWEAYEVRHEMRSSLEVVMYDSLNQSFEQIDAIAHWVNVCRKDGPTLVHCQAGLNRSSLIVARALILDGWLPENAISHLRTVRSDAVLCNRAFEEWLMR